MYDKTTLSAGAFDALKEEVIDELRDDYYPIFAVVRGSYARHCANDDSDYDVFAVVLDRDPAQYVTQTQMKTMSYEIPPTETIGLDKPIDLIAWDLHKFIQEANNSDPNAFKAAQSPLTLTAMDPLTGDPVGELRQHIVTQAKPFDLIRHYRSMAESNYQKYLQDDGGTTTDRRAKRWFIVVESLLRSLYIEQRCEAPPIDTVTLIDSVSIDESVWSSLRQLRAMKCDTHQCEATLEPGEIETAYTFILDEFQKDVSHEGYVGRDTDMDQLTDYAHQIAQVAWNQ